MQFLKNRLVETGLLLISIVSSQNLFSNPQNPSVIFGAASFDAVSDTVYQVHTGDLAIISWEQFSIQQGELTRFLQSSAGSAVLNRVMGGNLSEIYGTLESNGKIYLINPSGVIVGPDAVINTGSFIGSTFD